MSTIDAEGMLYLFNRYTEETVHVDALMADATAHEIEADSARQALRELVVQGKLQWVTGTLLQRAE